MHDSKWHHEEYKAVVPLWCKNNPCATRSSLLAMYHSLGNTITVVFIHHLQLTHIYYV